MRRVRYGPKALRDLQGIFVWISRDNRQAARRVRDRILLSIEHLTVFSTGRKGRVAGTFEKVVPGLPYIVIYAIEHLQNGDETVRVLSIRHTSRRPLG